MATSKRISRSGPARKSMDYDFLRRKGIEFAQQLSGDIWTDYNEHDPGVTILEHLAFALTDLSYRTNFPLTELLYARDDSKTRADETFFRPHEILPAAPQTVSDYRKFLIDRVEAVENAWIIPDFDNIHGYRGLYRVQLQLDRDYPEAQRRDMIRQVKKLLMANRNLAEDFSSVSILQTEALLIRADIHLMPYIEGEQVLARIIFALQQLLQPPITKYGYDGLSKMGEPPDQIFEGPLPRQFFIKTADLRPQPTSLNISRIREEISKVEGVRFIDQLVVRKDGVRMRGDEVPVSPNAYLVLSQELLSEKEAGHPLQLFRNGIPVKVDLPYSQQVLNSIVAAEREQYARQLEWEAPPRKTTKNLKDIRAYYSIQKLFPLIYGIGPYGIPDRSLKVRKAQARQLKAYLSLFELIMACYLAQLAGLKRFFSLEQAEGPSYYTQFPFDIPDVDSILRQVDQGEEENRRHRILQITEALMAEFDPHRKRKGRILDHLLARFGMEISEETTSRGNGKDLGDEDLTAPLLSAKTQFLKQMTTLSRDRFRAFDYTRPAWGTEAGNVSGLQQRLAVYLGAAPANRALSDLESFAGFDLSPTATEEEREDNLKLSLREMLRFGTQKYRYFVTIDEGANEYALFFRKTPEASPANLRPIYRPGSAEEAAREKCYAFRDRLIDKLQRINTGSKGFFLIEHILLRPTRGRKFKLVLRLTIEAQQEEVVFESPQAEKLEVLRDLADDLLIFGSGDNYIYEADAEDAYYIYIRQDDRRILRSRTRFSGRMVGTIIRQVKARLTEIRDRRPTEINYLIDFEDEKIAGHEVNSSFYSGQISLVMPSWPDIFQENNDYRNFFESLVMANAPAHLKVHLRWLNVRQMRRFETIYREWLSAKAAVEPASAEGSRELDDLSLQLLEFLKD